MGVYITPQEKIDEYFASDAVNQSKLKNISKGLAHYLKEELKNEAYNEPGAKKPDYFIIGSAVDLQLTGEYEEFDKQYYVSELETLPSEAERVVLDEVFSTMVSVCDPSEYKALEDYPGMIIDAAREHKYQTRWKPDTLVNHFVKVGTLYFEDMKKSVNKIVLSKDMNDKINSIVMSFRTHPRTAEYFDREVLSRNKNIDVYYQLVVYFTHKGVECKAMLDMVIVYKDDDGNIILVSPIDVKTMGKDTIDFPTEVKVRRYDAQAAWYTLAVQHYFGVDESKIDDFKFVVESTTDVGEPLVYTVDKELMVIGRHGRGALTVDNYVVSKEILGFEQMLNDYIWYLENEFSQDRRIAGSSDGVLRINWNGIINPKHATSQDRGINIKSLHQ
jgi:hypothetical protein